MDKKELRGQIELNIEMALAEFKKGISDKKFKKHIRKASKTLSDGLLLPAKKQKPKAKTASEETTPPKKAAPKKAAPKKAPAKK